MNSQSSTVTTEKAGDGVLSSTMSTIGSASATTTMTTLPLTSEQPTLASFRNQVEGGGGDQVISFHRGPAESTAHDKESVSSFTDIVQFDGEGHPTIDINRLVYQPHKTQAPHLQKEKLIWYLPDFCFILMNLLSLGVSTYFILAGVTTLSWVTSIGMFSLPNCTNLLTRKVVNNVKQKLSREVLENFYFLPCKDFFEDREGKFLYNDTDYNFNSGNHDFPLLVTKLTSVQTFGMVLIGLQLINIINVMVGINACLQGYKSLLVNHITMDGMVVLGEYLVSAIISYTGKCDDQQMEVVRMMLRHHINWYGHVIKNPEDESDKEKLLSLQVDGLQTNLGCCGVDSWMDYMDAQWPFSDWAPTREGMDDTEMVIPFSCCQKWWIRNLYCSSGTHLWMSPAAPKEMVHRFKERIVQEGCMYKLSETCERLKLFMGKWGIYATNVFLVLLILEAVAALILIRNINHLINENKKLMRKKEMAHEGDSADALDSMLLMTNMDTSKSMIKLTTKDQRWSVIAPPTEDEILTIKQRSNFNRFMAHIKGGFVDRWMQEAQAIVTEGQEESRALLAQTDEERKQREKELLHRKKDHEVVHKDRPSDEQPPKEEQVEEKVVQSRKALGVPSHKVRKMTLHKKHTDEEEPHEEKDEGEEEVEEEERAHLKPARAIGVPSHRVRSIHHPRTHSEDEEEKYHKPPPLHSMPSRPSLKKGIPSLSSLKKTDSKVQWKEKEKKRIEKNRATRKGIKARAKTKPSQSEEEEELELELIQSSSEEEGKHELDEEEQKKKKTKKRRLSRKKQLRRARKRKLEADTMDRSARPWIKYF